MIRFFISRPAVVHLIVLLIVVTGVLSLKTMTVELWPPVEINMVTVQTFYPGASPEEVEKLVTIPLEDELDGLDGVDYIESISREGASTVAVNYLAEVPEAKMDDYTRDVQQRVNRVQNLPDEASTPLVEKIATENIPVGIFALSGPREELVVKRLAEDLQDELEDLPGAKKVWLTAIREREVAVVVNQQRLESYGLSPEDVRRAIAQRHYNLPAGSLFTGRTELLLRVLGKPEELAGLGDIILRVTGGGYVYLRDVATIEDTFKDPAILSHLNGERCAMLMLAKEKLASTTTLIDRARAIVDSFCSRHPDLSVELVWDSSIIVRRRMRELVTNGAQGFVLVVLILWFNIGWRRGLIVALGIPVSFLATFVIMKFLAISLNFMTLYAMFIVLGILVDDAIVVVENITRHSEEGMTPRRAALTGTKQVVFPVIIAVTTTMVAFATMLVMKGTLGKFMGYLPKVVIIVLGISLFESLLVAPSHVAEWVPYEPAGSHRRLGADRSLAWLRQRLEGLLRRLLALPWLAAAIPPLIVVLTVAVASRQIKVEMFPPEEPDEIYVTFELPPGTSLPVVEQVAFEVDAKIRGLGLEDIRTTYSAIGYSMDQELGQGSRKNLGQVICVLKDRADRAISGFATMDALRDNLTGQFAGLESFKVGIPEGGPPAGTPIYVRLEGDDFEVLEALAEEVKTFVRRWPGVINLEDDRRPGNPELQLRLNEEKAARSGVDFGTLALSTRALFVGAKAVERRIDEENVDITVRGEEGYRRGRDALRTVTVPSVTGEPVPLLTLVDVIEARGPAAVMRRDGRHTVTVTGDIAIGPDRRKLANAAEINRAISQEFSARVPVEHPGYSVGFGGEAEQQAESFGSLGIAFVAAMLLIYGLLVLQFNSLSQPAVIMLTVPTTIVGVLLGMLLFRETFGLSHGIGLVALVGIAVNDAVVYIDYINYLRREEGKEGLGVLIEAAQTRLRPILLTSLTTIMGLLPMALKLGGGSAYLSPLASTIIYGLLAQTFFTLVFIPVGLVCVEQMTEVFQRHITRRILPPEVPGDTI